MDDDELAKRFANDNPLATFSIYTQAQYDALERTRDQLRSYCPLVGADGIVSAAAFREYYDLFWLWTLGAYEVLRTMAAHPGCFSGEAFSRILSLKMQAANLRVPFAKQELRGQKRGAANRFYSENSIKGVENGLTFVINDQHIESEQFMDEVLRGMRAIQPEDIVKEMPINRPPKTL